MVVRSLPSARWKSNYSVGVSTAALGYPAGACFSSDLEDTLTSKRKAATAPRAATPATATSKADGDREMMPVDKRDEAVKRLARASGQVAGISRMIDDGRHCTDVLQQIAAVQKALDAVGNIVMRNYLERCVTTAIEGGDPLIYDELMTVFARYR